MRGLKLISTVVTPSFYQQRIAEGNNSNKRLRQYTSYSKQNI